MGDNSVIFDLIGKDNISTILNFVGGNFKNLAEAIIGVAAAGAGLIKIGEDFQTSFDTISKTTGATGEKLQALEGTFKQVLEQVPASMASVTTTLDIVSQTFGLTGDALEKLTIEFQQLSDMTGIDTASAVQELNGALLKFGEPASSAGAELNTFFSIAQKTGISMGDLLNDVNSAAPILAQYGVGLDDTAQMMGTFAQAGMNATSMLVALKRLAGEDFAKPSPLGKGGGPDIPLAAYMESILGGIQENLQQSTPGGVLAAQTTAIQELGSKAGLQMVTALQDGTLSMDSFSNTNIAATTTIGGTADSTMNLSQRLEELKNKIEVELEPVAMKFITMLESAINFISAHEAFLTPVVSALGAFAIAIKVAQSAIAAWNVILFVAANPVALIVILIAVIVIAIIVLWERSAAFRDFWIDTWKIIQDVITPVAIFLEDTFKVVAKVFEDLWNGSVVNTIINALQTIPKFFENIYDWVVKTGQDIWSAGAHMWDGITAPFKAAINFIISAWDSLHFTIPSFDLFGFHTPSITIGLPHIPMLADGGNVTAAGLALVGENGPEMLSLPQGAQVTPLNGGGGIGGGQVVTLQLQGADREFLTFLQKIVRVQGGGNVQKALGS